MRNYFSLSSVNNWHISCPFHILLTSFQLYSDIHHGALIGSLQNSESGGNFHYHSKHNYVTCMCVSKIRMNDSNWTIIKEKNSYLWVGIEGYRRYLYFCGCFSKSLRINLRFCLIVVLGYTYLFSQTRHIYLPKQEGLNIGYGVNTDMKRTYSPQSYYINTVVWSKKKVNRTETPFFDILNKYDSFYLPLVFTSCY